jgi:hypothetical protein
VTETTNPGVQNPHCSPCVSQNARCTGPSEPGSSPASTVHDPHTPCSHARWVPVSPSS